VYGCRWLFLIRVVLLQALKARQLMSPSRRDFEGALLEACGVNWMQTPCLPPASGPCVGEEGRLALRTPPAELLCWGPNARPAHSVDDLGKWLTSGPMVPNFVLFAPVVAHAMRLTWWREGTGDRV